MQNHRLYPDAPSPESILQKKNKAGLLTRLLRTTFPPDKAVANKSVRSEKETHSYGYSLGLSPSSLFILGHCRGLKHLNPMQYYEKLAHRKINRQKSFQQLINDYQHSA